MRVAVKLARTADPGTPLVLLHPLGVDRRFWSPVLAALAPRPVLLVDLPGHGRSPSPASPYSVQDAAAGVAAALEAEGCLRAHVAGVSLGGLVAQALAADAPWLVDHLVLVDTVAVYDPAQQAMWRSRARLVTGSRDALSEIIEATLTAWFTDTGSDAAVTTAASLREVDRRGYAGGCLALAGADTRAATAALRARTLIVCGREDAPHFRAGARWLHEALQDSQLVWLPGKHAAVLERPRLFGRLVDDFLATERP